ncbi:MAG: DUF1003 domain-containing protein [Candidatus Neomarinimicrobiota bacterium]
MKNQTKVTCQITKREMSPDQCYPVNTLRNSMLNLIREDFPDIDSNGCISIAVVNDYRRKYITNLISQESGEVRDLEQEVVEAISGNKILSENIEDQIEEKRTLGQRVADKIAALGGSWTFILIFFSFILFWIGINIWLLTVKPFDPYPFILLNLILSCLAAIQAPIIMMSQNRQEHKDRIRNEHDYKINLKAELEIKMMNEKIDHLIVHQNRRLLEIQEIQADFLEDILKIVKHPSEE